MIAKASPAFALNPVNAIETLDDGDAAFTGTIQAEQILCPRQNQDEIRVRVVNVVGDFDAARL